VFESSEALRSRLSEMRKLLVTMGCAMGAGLLLTAFQSQTRHASSSEYPTPLIREEQTVVVGGVAETWQLKWTTPPKPVCEPGDVALTCPCMGFAYGEGGDLVLVRLHDQVEVDRLEITPLFEGEFAGRGRVAIIQRWQTERYDLDENLKGDLPAMVAKRPVVQVMHLADYDHDGQKSEFYLQITTQPCGKNVGVLIGVSAGNPRLHVFGTATKPAEPMFMQEHEWEALHGTKGPVEVTDWTCGDHGADTETTLRLRWTPDGLAGTRRQFTCPPNPRRLIAESPL
jgi:hypothetical protein